MESMSEPRYTLFLARIGLPTICLGQYFGISFMIYMLFLVECPPLVIGITVSVAVVIFAMFPVWYKTFFDNTYIGIDGPLRVQWSAERVVFTGAYFKLDVGVEDILHYRIIGFRAFESTFMLKLRIRKPNGRIESTFLSIRMPRKNQFITFLEQHRPVQEDIAAS